MFTLSHTVYKEIFGISEDHYPCIINIPCKGKENEVETNMIRQIKNMNFEIFKKDLDVVLNKIVNSDNNFEDPYESYRQDAEELLNRYCPLETKKVKAHYGWTKNIRKQDQKGEN